MTRLAALSLLGGCVIPPVDPFLPSVQAPILPPPASTAPVDAPTVDPEPMSRDEARAAVNEAMGDKGRILQTHCEAHHCRVTVVGEIARTGRDALEQQVEAKGLTVLKGRVTKVQKPEEWLWTLIVSKGPLREHEREEARAMLATDLDAALRAYRPPEASY